MKNQTAAAEEELIQAQELPEEVDMEEPDDMEEEDAIEDDEDLSEEDYEEDYVEDEEDEEDYEDLSEEDEEDEPEEEPEGDTGGEPEEEPGKPSEPTVQSPQEELEALRRRLEELERGIAQSSSIGMQAVNVNEIWQRDLAEIKSRYPSEKADSIRDLGQEFATLMRTGLYSAPEAYEISHRKELGKLAEKAAAEKAVKSVKSKEHLKSSGGSTGKAAAVPQEVLDMYHAINPGMTDTQIAKHYSKSLKD